MKVKKNHTFDEETYAKAQKIAEKMSKGGHKFELSPFLNDKLEEFVKEHEYLLKEE